MNVKYDEPMGWGEERREGWELEKEHVTDVTDVAIGVARQVEPLLGVIATCVWVLV